MLRRAPTHTASLQPTAVTTPCAWQVLPRFSQHAQVILHPGRAHGHAPARFEVCSGCPCPGPAARSQGALRGELSGSVCCVLCVAGGGLLQAVQLAHELLGQHGQCALHGLGWGRRARARLQMQCHLIRVYGTSELSVRACRTAACMPVCRSVWVLCCCM